jgi:7-cyano-7-deazaguanine synthase
METPNSESPLSGTQIATSGRRVAVLFSSGLDSAVLAAAQARDSVVFPIYVCCGLAWETEELAAAHRLFGTSAYRNVQPIARLAFTVADLYSPNHWALRGTPPGFDTPDEDVYLTGRNLVLLSKAAIYCAQQHVEAIAIGTLAGNPFPDATGDFFRSLARAVSLGLAREIAIEAPCMRMDKADVIRLGRELGVPLELTLSCMNPRDGEHCGECSKCRERRDAFREAEVEDLTRYRRLPPR